MFEFLFKLKGKFMSEDTQNVDTAVEGQELAGQDSQQDEVKSDEEVVDQVKTDEVKQDEVAPAEVAAVEPETTLEISDTTEAKIVFHGVEVVGFVGEGDTESDYHCHMADGTTTHVPKMLFPVR